MMEPSFNFWDNLAKRYPHYNDPAMSKDVRFILEWCENKGVSFNNVSILDIGCGTGTIAIPFAQKGAQVTAIDVSAGMLDVLQEDAKEIGLMDKITIHQSDWDAFALTSKYDLVIASMTPAISDESKLEKMLDATHDVGIYVGWGKYRNNKFVDALIKCHDVPDDVGAGGCIKTEQFMKAMNLRQIPFECEFFEASWQEEFTPQEAKSYAYDQLKRKNVEPDDEKIDAILQEYLKDGKVIVETEAEKGIVLFSTCKAKKAF